MALTVLEIAYALAPPVGPDAMGGAEQVLGLVDAALVRAGHRSLVVAAAGSQVAGALVPTPARPPRWDDAARLRAEREHEAAIRRALASARVDLVHLHGLDFARFLPEGPPALVTLHLPPAWYPPGSLRPRGRELAFACVSEAQARALPPGARLAAVVPNGVPLDVYRPAPARGPYALVVARICPEKGVAPALAAAHDAGVPLLVCGAALPYPEHLRYLDEQVRPLLDGDRRLLGSVGRDRKARLLAAARCVVIPSVAPETSSLVAMEALASGAPVVARRVGALPEIVEDGRTGILVDRDDELGPAIREAARLSPDDCRRAAEARFSAEAAGRRWVEVAERLARHPRPRPAPLRVEVLAGPGALAAIRGEWSALCDRAPGATPFQRPEWLLPWCRAFGVTEPFAVALRARGRLAGLAPLVVFQDGPRRVATLLGAGVSDYQDALVDPAVGPPGAELLLSAALAGASARGAGALLLEHLPEGSPLVTAGAGAGGEASPDGVCPVLAPAPGTAPLERAARRLRENVRYGRRRLARAGARITTATGHDLEPHLDALFAVHAARWRARGAPGVLAPAALRRFHREAARGLLARWVLRLHVLWVDGRAAAAFLGFLDRGRAYYYLGGFDPALRAASPGAVVIAHAVEQAVDEGARELDFLRGREAYKYDWGARDRRTWRRVLGCGTGAAARAVTACARSPARAPSSSSSTRP